MSLATTVQAFWVSGATDGGFKGFEYPNPLLHIVMYIYIYMHATRLTMNVCSNRLYLLEKTKSVSLCSLYLHQFLDGGLGPAKHGDISWVG